MIKRRWIKILEYSVAFIVVVVMLGSFLFGLAALGNFADTGNYLSLLWVGGFFVVFFIALYSTTVFGKWFR